MIRQKIHLVFFIFCIFINCMIIWINWCPQFTYFNSSYSSFPEFSESVVEDHRHQLNEIYISMEHQLFYILNSSNRDAPVLMMKSPNFSLSSLHAFMKSKFGLKESIHYEITSNYHSESTDVTHVHLRQMFNGITIENAVLNLNFNNKMELVSYGSTFSPCYLTNFYHSEDDDGSNNGNENDNDSVLYSLPLSQIKNVDEYCTHQDSFDFFDGTYLSLADPHIKQSPLDGFLALLTYLESSIIHAKNINDLKQIKILKSLKKESEWILHHAQDDYIQSVSFILETRNSLEQEAVFLPKIPIKLSYLLQADGRGIQLVWSIELELHINWFHAHVSTMSGEVVSLINWVSDAAKYLVFPIGINDPSSGQRKFANDSSFFSKKASPYGWQSTFNKNYTYTRGNNIIAQDNINTSTYSLSLFHVTETINHTEQRYDWQHHHGPTSESLIFDFPLDLNRSPRKYKQASVTNLFYWCNTAHDLFYALGFDEKSGNFQEYNFHRGGKDQDAIIAYAQDSSSLNNAHFASPPDGQRGRMTMFVWDMVKPHRDGDLEADIIIHEYTHGVSTRLTGGPANSGCLGWDEAGGMGEGWGDFFATIWRMNSSTWFNQSFEIASYANGGSGIRRFPYSPNFKINPSTYAFIRKSEYRSIHSKGEVWAQILLEIFYELTKKYGFLDDWYHHLGSHLQYGNIIMAQLVIDGMKLQPCYPTFIYARDSIILADKLRNGGENQCLLWNGFAKRGMGMKARKGGYEDFSVPHYCQS